MKLGFAVLAVSLLVGCQDGGIGMAGSPAWHMTATQEQKIAHYQQTCAAYGFKSGSKEMAQCVQNESQGARNNAARRLDSLSAPQPMPAVRTTNCQQWGRQINCQSY